MQAISACILAGRYIFVGQMWLHVAHKTCKFVICLSRNIDCHVKHLHRHEFQDWQSNHQYFANKTCNLSMCSIRHAKQQLIEGHILEFGCLGETICQTWCSSKQTLGQSNLLNSMLCDGFNQCKLCYKRHNSTIS